MGGKALDSTDLYGQRGASLWVKPPVSQPCSEMHLGGRLDWSGNDCSRVILRRTPSASDTRKDSSSKKLVASCFLSSLGLVEYRGQIHYSEGWRFMLSKTQWLRLAMLVVASQFLTVPSFAQTPGYQSDTRAYNVAHGRVVFMDKCMRCHESGKKGAPVLGEASDWKERLEQPLGTLIEHAIAGHGDMPARGDQDISEQDVAAAVAYVVDRTRTIIIADVNSLPPHAAGASADNVDAQSDRAVVHMFMLMLGKERWK